jgi:K+-transporting ATPase KdpF subunit
MPVADEGGARPANRSDHAIMANYLLLMIVGIVVIYLFYALIHPERF